MAELSSHSYHYKDSIFYQQENQGSNDDDEDSESKKKPRRRKKMLTGVSKQRRAANERERKRLQIINMAYKELKGVLPLFPNEDNIPKIEIVRLATRTIRYLSDILNDNANLNDLESMLDCRMRRGFSEESDSSPDPTNNIGDITSDIKLDTLDTDIDVSNLLFQTDDIKLDFESTLQQSDIDGSSMSSSDGFSGLDISSFIGSTTSDCRPAEEDVFPSMLYW